MIKLSLPSMNSLSQEGFMGLNDSLRYHVMCNYGGWAGNRGGSKGTRSWKTSRGDEA